MVAGSAGSTEGAADIRRGKPESGGDARRVPEELPPARAGLPRGPGRGQHAAGGSRPAGDALPAAEEPRPAARAGGRDAGVHDRDRPGLAARLLVGRCDLAHRRGEPGGRRRGAVGRSHPGAPGDVGCPAHGAPLAGSWSPRRPTPCARRADLNYDFRMDLALAGAGGLCLLRQRRRRPVRRRDRPGEAARTAPSRPCLGVWPADIDTDGDLDLVLAPRDGHPLVLRNNGDGTFTPRDPFAAVTRARGFAWADLDGEGVPDAAFLDDAGVVHVFVNLRGGSLPRRDAAGHLRARRGDRGGGTERRLAVRSARARLATAPSRACRARHATARGRGRLLSRVDPPPRGWSRASHASSPPISTTTAPPI